MKKMLSMLLLAGFAASMTACAIDMSSKHDCDKPCCKSDAAAGKACSSEAAAGDMKECCKAKVAAGEKACCEAKK